MKKLLVILLIITVFLIGTILVFTSKIPNSIRWVIPISTRHNYSSIKEALHDNNYLDYPAISLPIKGDRNGIYYNPITNVQLELDTSEGGGYACCEQPTFYVWADRNDNIFWINTYQASLGSVNDHWYGPFSLLFL